MCFNQRHFISINLPWRFHVSFNFLVDLKWKLFYWRVNSITSFIRFVQIRRFCWYTNSLSFKTHKCFFFHKFRLLLRYFWTWLDVLNLWKSLQHAPTQERDDFIKHCSRWFGFTLQGWFEFSSFHWQPSYG